MAGVERRDREVIGDQVRPDEEGFLEHRKGLYSALRLCEQESESFTK